MARLFTGSTDRLENTSVAAVGAAGSIFIRLKPAWAHNDSAIHVVWHHGNTNQRDFPSFQKYSDNNVYIGFYTGSEQRIVVAASAAMFTNGTWTNHIFTWTDAGDEEKYYADNVEVGSRTTTLTTATEAGLCIGNYNTAANSSGDIEGNLAEYGLWNRVLDAAERAVLQVTGTPMSVPNGLVSWIPLIGKGSPEPDLRTGIGLTVSGAIAAAHPRVIYPGRGRTNRTIAVVAGTVVRDIIQSGIIPFAR